MTKSSALFSLRILTINTHKGFTTFNRRFVLPQLRDAIRSVNPDIVCLQEVLGEHDSIFAHIIAAAVFHLLADSL